MLIMNIVLGIDDRDPKIIESGKFDPKVEMCAVFTNFDTQN